MTSDIVVVVVYFHWYAYGVSGLVLAGAVLDIVATILVALFVVGQVAWLGSGGFCIGVNLIYCRLVCLYACCLLYVNVAWHDERQLLPSCFPSPLCMLFVSRYGLYIVVFWLTSPSYCHLVDSYTHMCWYCHFLISHCRCRCRLIGISWLVTSVSLSTSPSSSWR